MGERFAVISDVHGNYKALEAFFGYLSEHPVDGIIGLGDYVTDSPYPERTIALLQQMRELYTCYMVRGNRENYLLGDMQKTQGWKPSSASGCLYYTAEHLTKENLDFLGSLPEEMPVNIAGCPALFLCHGTPGNVRGNTDYHPELKAQALQQISGAYLLGGHSHIQEIYTSGQKTYLNPGSLGYALDGIGRHAHFAVICGDACGWSIELKSITYDVEAFLEDFTKSGLDELAFVMNRAVKKMMLTGVNYVMKCVSEVERMTGLPPYRIPEEVWEQAAQKLGV